MKSTEYEDQLKAQIEEEKKRKEQLTLRRDQLNKHIDRLISDSTNLLRTKLEELNIPGESATADTLLSEVIYQLKVKDVLISFCFMVVFVFYQARNIVIRHKEIQAEVTELQQEVTALEKEKELLVEERKKELMEHCRREGWINGTNPLDDEQDKLCRRYLVTEITATLNHRKKLENKLAQYEPEIVALEKRFQQQQVQAQIIAMQQQIQPSPQSQQHGNSTPMLPQASPKLGLPQPSPQHQKQQPLNMNNKEKKNLSRSRSQEWPDLPDMAKINEDNPELLAKKIIEAGRELEAGKVPKKGAPGMNETPLTTAPGLNNGRRKSGSGPSIDLPTVQMPMQIAEKQQNIPAPKVNFFEDRLKNLITSVLNEDNPSSASENHSGMSSLPQGGPRSRSIEREPPNQLGMPHHHPHSHGPHHPSHQKNMHQQHNHPHLHPQSHPRHHQGPPGSQQFHPQNPQSHLHAHHQGPPHHGPPSHHSGPPPHQAHIIPINVPINPLLPHQQKQSQMIQPSQQMSPATAEPGQKKKIQLSPDITSVGQLPGRNSNVPLHSPGRAALKNHLNPINSVGPHGHDNRAVRNLNFNHGSSQGQHGQQGHHMEKTNNPRTISDLMASEIETSLGIAPRSAVAAFKASVCTASPPVRGIGPYSPISRPNSNENIPEALSSFGGSRATVLVNPPRSSGGSDRGHGSHHHHHHGQSQQQSQGGDDSLMNEGLAAGLKARIISMAKSSAINLENKIEGSNSGGSSAPSSGNSGGTAASDKSQPASTTILLSSPLVKEKKVVESPSGGVTVEVVLGSSDGADDMDVDRSDNGNASVLRVVRKRVSDPSMNVSHFIKQWHFFNNGNIFNIFHSHAYTLRS